MKVVDIADEIYRDLGSPTDLSIPAISFWLRANIGVLNNIIFHDYSIDPDTLEFTENLQDGTIIPFTDDEKAIIKSLYMIHFYDVKIQGSLGASGYNSALEVTTDGATVRLSSKTEIAKTYALIKKGESENLDKLTAGYKIKKSLPRQVAGDDTIRGINTLDIYPNRSVGGF